MGLGDKRAAVELCDKAIQIYERLVTHEGRSELLGNLSWAKQKKASLL
jgi:hypothetical protein